MNERTFYDARKSKLVLMVVLVVMMVTRSTAIVVVGIHQFRAVFAGFAILMARAMLAFTNLVNTQALFRALEHLHPQVHNKAKHHAKCNF